MQYIPYLDLFGATYKPKLPNAQNQQKSILGGLATILLYSISLVYFIYVCIQWQTNRILPKTTTMNKIENYSEFTFTQSRLFELAYWRYSSNLIDPFSLQDNILMPISVQFLDGYPQEVVSLLGDNGVSVYNSNIITVQNMSLTQNGQYDPELKPISEYLIVIAKCQPNLLKDNQTCASEEQIQQFYDQAVNYISLWIHLSQFNPNTQQIETVKKQIYLPLSIITSSASQILFKPIQISVDDGLLFEQNSYYNLINDVNLISSNVEASFFQKLIHYDSYLSIFLRLDPIQTELQVTYPKIGEVLAQVGSIVSILLIAKHAMVLFNEYLLDECLINEVIAMYCPEVIDFRMQSKPKTKNKSQVSDKMTQYYLLIYNEYKSYAQEKLKLTNLIYEVSRLQFVIQQIHGRGVLAKSHDMQINIYQEAPLYSQSVDTILNTNRPNAMLSNKLRKDDFGLLIRQQKQQVQLGECQLIHRAIE